MKNQKRTITKKEKDMKKLSGRLLKLFKDHGYDVENNCHAIPDLIVDMEKEGFILPKGGYDAIHRHVYDDVKDINVTWLKIYCDFFHCSADYILGYISMPTHEKFDIHEKSGLSSKALSSLLANEDYRLVTDLLLTSNGMDYIVQAIEATLGFEHKNKYISKHLPNMKIPGMTKDDMQLYISDAKAGNKDQLEAIAIVCFDNMFSKLKDKKITSDKTLLEYFDDKITKKFIDNLNSDLQSK